ncbi:MAG: ATP-dependent DNA helicase RecG [Clostridia bacterium]|nr:ATP-dependent DNA helicase RecG [Clostridia bacterium]
MAGVALRFIPGIGEQREQILRNLGIETAEDLLHYYPRAYEDRSCPLKLEETVAGEVAACILTVRTPVRERIIRKGLSLYTLLASDETGTCEITFFNQKYIFSQLKQGKAYLFYGRMEGDLIRKQMKSPAFEPVDDFASAAKIVPVYPLSEGITQKILRKSIGFLLANRTESLEENIPLEIRQKYALCEKKYAVRNIHAPENFESLAIARRRLVFEELLQFRLGLLAIRSKNTQTPGIPMPLGDSKEFVKALPFTLTNAQRRVIEEIRMDLQRSVPMSRLVQGDVGCGKTMVAAAAIWLAVQNGWQCALMAPTEILAKQHFEGLQPLFARWNISVVLLNGSMTAKEKRESLTKIASGEAQVAVGTHSLIGEQVCFKNLGLVVCDEQHRFGVQQRAMLSAKGEAPHLLVMSATPIPRTLALILYGELDISVIDEMPPGRQKVNTFCIGEEKREGLYGFVQRQVAEGGQCYFVCSLAEDGDGERKAAEEYALHLQEVLPQCRVAFLHGKMKASQKEAVMKEFAEGKIHVLVSTTVIEVGVNVPNATLMVVENAERFGLSQLHQLRGRVGRGQRKSYCMLFCEDKGAEAARRMAAMCETNDGFVIAKRDLELRGPGDFFGNRQHGLPEFRLADIASDMAVMEQAREAAELILNGDPLLQEPRHQVLAQQVDGMFSRCGYGAIFN